MIPEVMQAVTGRRPRGEPALLRHHARRLLVGRDYPGVIPRQGEHTDGVLYRSLDFATWERLDAFEDDCYERRSCQVEVAAAARIAAEVYAIPPAQASLLSTRPWLRSTFERELPAWLRRLRS